MRLAAVLAVVLVLAACGGHKPPSAEDVARAWSAALNRNDNDAAASLFAPDAKVIQNGTLKLSDHAAAASWNSLLPCGGRITSVEQRSADEVVAEFDLIERPGHACDGTGHKAAALFRVHRGKIVLWQQVGPSESAGQTV